MAPSDHCVDAAGARVPPLQGGRNFRDIGGYFTQDGRRVKWGRVFRSGSPAALTQADWEYLVATGVRHWCDLRSTAEREAAPFLWREATGVAYWARDYVSSFGELRALIASDLASVAAAQDAMMAGYRRLPFEQAPAYRAIFARVKAADGGLVFNCSAGKDRAGMGAALLLQALGVTRAQVIEDYLLSNQFAAFARGAADTANPRGLLARQSPEVVAAIMSCDARYLEAAFAAIDKNCGCFSFYVRDFLGIDDGELDFIRRGLLE